MSSFSINNWESIYNSLLINLVNDSGTWTRNSIQGIEKQGINVIKAKHSFKGIYHRGKMLLNKLLYQ